MPIVSAANKEPKSTTGSNRQTGVRKRHAASINKTAVLSATQIKQKATSVTVDRNESRFDSIRGYIKISDAAKAFCFDFRHKTVLDIGSSTGGFTKYALDHGAKKVIAVEKGTNQMLPQLRCDKRIELHEKTDIFDFALDYAPDAIVADISFLSLTKVLHYVKHHLSDTHTEFLVMLKPQFEAKPNQLLNGVVKNSKIRREIITGFEQWLKKNGFLIVNKRDNQLKGKNGNIERFYWLKQTAD